MQDNLFINRVFTSNKLLNPTKSNQLLFLKQLLRLKKMKKKNFYLN